MTKLSAAIISKNEEKVIERCLKSLSGVDEIVVVDTGSTDSTVQLAQAYAKVYTDYTWKDDFSEARNHALSKCTGEWIIVIDCDEYLPEGMIDVIRESLDDNFSGIDVKLVWDTSHHHTQPRIVRKGVLFSGRVHEAVSCTRKPSDVWWHYTRSPAHELDPNRNLRILLENHEEPRALFYLGHEYQDRKDWAQAVFWYTRYLKVATWRPEIADAHLSMARCLWYMNRGDKARNQALLAMLANPNFKEAFLLMAEMSWEKQKKVWLSLADVADNSDVLFVRTG